MLKNCKLGIEKKTGNNEDASSDFILIKLNQDVEEAQLPSFLQGIKLGWKLGGDKQEANLEYSH